MTELIHTDTLLLLLLLVVVMVVVVVVVVFYTFWQVPLAALLWLGGVGISARDGDSMRAWAGPPVAVDGDTSRGPPTDSSAHVTIAHGPLRSAVAKVANTSSGPVRNYII